MSKVTLSDLCPNFLSLIGFCMYSSSFFRYSDKHTLLSLIPLVSS